MPGRPWPCRADRPGRLRGAWLAALFFGLIAMLQYPFQAELAAISHEIPQSLPALATVVALAWRGQGVRPPAALGMPFLK